MKIKPIRLDVRTPHHDRLGGLDLRADVDAEAGLLSALYMAFHVGGTITIRRHGEVLCKARVGDEAVGPADPDPEVIPLPDAIRRVADPAFTMTAGELIERLRGAMAACGGAGVPTYFGPADGPTPVIAVVPSWRNGRSGRISDGTGDTCRRILVIL